MSLTTLDEIAADLLRETAANRVTIRLADSDHPDYPVVGEATRPGIDSIRGVPLKSVTVPVVNLMRTSRRSVVQRDVFTSDPPVPAAFESWRVRAQMLGPLFDGDEFYGIISVHVMEDPREWTDEDVSALERARERMAEKRRLGELGVDAEA